MIDWPVLLGESGTLRQRLHELKPDTRPYTVPKIAATEEQILEAEARLGRRLDMQYREFLSYANGWNYFHTYTHLFGTSELGVGEMWDKANEMLDIYYSDGPIPADYPRREDLFPIAAGEYVTDVIAIWETGPVTANSHPVLWIGGEEIDRYENFHEFVLAANQYIKNNIERCTA